MPQACATLKQRNDEHLPLGHRQAALADCFSKAMSDVWRCHRPLAPPSAILSEWHLWKYSSRSSSTANIQLENDLHGLSAICVSDCNQCHQAPSSHSMEHHERMTVETDMPSHCDMGIDPSKVKIID